MATGAIHVATAAGRARVLMMQRQLPEALSLLCAAQKVAPEVPYLGWVQRWLQPEIVSQLPFDLLFESIVKCALGIGVDTPVPPEEGDRRVPNLRAAAETFAVLRAQHPNEVILWFGESLLRRRLDRQDLTLQIAEEGVRRFPQDWGLRTALLNALRDAGRPDEALEQARAAMQIAPDKGLSPLHDAAQGFLTAGRATGSFEQAAGLFEELLSKDPHYPGAPACLYYTRYRARGVAEDLEALRHLRELSPWDRDIRRMANEVDPPRPYETVLPSHGDATLSAARHLASEIAPVLGCCGAGAKVELRLSSQWMESPSVEVAFDLAMRAAGGSEGALSLAYEEIQQPDPRQDKSQLALRIWSFEGDRPVPAAPSGDPAAQQAVASLARQPFGRERWDAAAEQIAAQGGEAGLNALLSVLLHPPMPEGGFDPFTWTWRCQVAVAAITSHLGVWESGWGRHALYAMLFGPSDWVSAAALVALGWRAQRFPQHRAEIEGTFEWLRGLIPQQGYTAWEIVLAEVWAGLPGLSPERQQDLQAWIARYEETITQKNTVRTPERRYGGLTLEEYARFTVLKERILSASAPGQSGYDMLQAVANAASPPQELAQLCQDFHVPLRHPRTGGMHADIDEWREALNQSPPLQRLFVKAKRTFELESRGVAANEQAALEQVLDGKMDMHLRMAQAQQAQAQADADDDPDPVVFPNQPVARLSDYVAILKGMQTGDMVGPLARYGLDIMSYGGVAQAWAAKMTADPLLTEKFNRMMNS